jgi:hypothetical protein
MQLGWKETQVCAVDLFSYTSITRMELSLRSSTNKEINRWTKSATRFILTFQFNTELTPNSQNQAIGFLSHSLTATPQPHLLKPLNEKQHAFQLDGEKYFTEFWKCCEIRCGLNGLSAFKDDRNFKIKWYFTEIVFCLYSAHTSANKQFYNVDIDHI